MAARTGGRPRFVRAFVLLASLSVIAVILGLLTMHTLNLHGTPAARGPSMLTISTTQGTPLGAGAAEQHHQAGPAVASCADCGTPGDHLGIAIACVLALVILLLVVPPPVLLPAWMSGAGRASPLAVVTRLLNRAPSLHVLCVSRI
ncbi:DUF6153 family protein [Tessaracoccus sp. OS52]|uniref:DUF6153 family protein n=1 Tax=Tessaracoccus sp. OS52 TaxID=2886691 RepID=UPI001D126DAF|nr:DUF6153 family protein [Tessaracoccus sp. OS52]